MPSLSSAERPAVTSRSADEPSRPSPARRPSLAFVRPRSACAASRRLAAAASRSCPCARREVERGEEW